MYSRATAEGSTISRASLKIARQTMTRIGRMTSFTQGIHAALDRLLKDFMTSENIRSSKRERDSRMEAVRASAIHFHNGVSSTAIDTKGFGRKRVTQELVAAGVSAGMA